MNSSRESLEQKLAHLRRLANENPSLVAPRVQIGLLLEQAGRLRNAREAFLEVLEIDPDNSYVKFRLEALDQGRSGIAPPPVHYTFSTQREKWMIGLGIRIAAMLALLAVGILAAWLFLFPSTVRIVINGDNNSFPVWSPDGQHFGFQTTGGSSQIFRAVIGGRFVVCNSAATTCTPLEIPGANLGDGNSVSDFHWSADGQYLAFILRIQRLPHICLARTDGTGFVDLGTGRSFAWAPRGTDLALAAFRSAEPATGAIPAVGQLVVYDPDIRQRKDLGAIAGHAISWSPDASRIVILCPADSETVESIPTTGAAPESRGPEASSPAEPVDAMDIDSATIASMARAAVSNDLSIVTVATGQAKQLTTGGTSASPVWLGSGSGILYFRRSNRQQYELWRIDPDGHNARRLYGNELGISYAPDVMVSPDGKWITFERYFAEAPGSQADIQVPEHFDAFDDRNEVPNEALFTDIYIARTDGSDCHRLVNVHDSKSAPVFSPDSRWIAYHVSPVGTKTQIWKTKVK